MSRNCLKKAKNWYAEVRPHYCLRLDENCCVCFNKIAVNVIVSMDHNMNL